ncbi:DUF6531 domain-containing protein [Streptomyces sp. 6N223]|uniref:DUF6531 domain-containing protein n=1 Tax=Streptomyces sp. 6N223 TaxID=3457412 RepID=UPI003FD257BD
MGRNSDWSPVGMDEDPTPGDPERIAELADSLLSFADDVATALSGVREMSGDGAIQAMTGETADAFAERFEDIPDNLTKLQESYELAGLALQRYGPLLASAQQDADAALEDAEEAQTDLTSAQDWLTQAASALETAQEEDEPEGPDEEQLRSEVRRAVDDATTDRDNAQSAVDSAQSRLDAATRLAEQAKAAREEAARRCVEDLEEASDAGMQNLSWWERVTDWVSDNWDGIMQVVQIAATVLAVVALVVGGPLVWGLMLAASAIILADTLVKYANGEASLWDVGFAALDCIPGGRFIGRGASLARTGLRRTSSEIAGETPALRRTGRRMDGRNECGDPVDVATGELVMSTTDLELPGILPLTVERHHISTYQHGRWFGRSYASTLDQRLVLELNGVRFFSSDGMVLHYPVPLPDPENPVQPVEGPRWPLAWNGQPGGEMTVHQPDTGHTLHFTPVPGRRANELPLTAVTDRNTNRIELHYDGQGAPAEMAHSGGYRVGIATYDERVTSLRLLSAPAEPFLIAYDYDQAGNLASVFNSSGLPLALSYDEKDRLIRWEDRSNTWYRYEYDADGRVVFSTGTDRALEYRYHYDPDNHRTTATNSLGHATVYQFDEGYQLVSVTDPLGHTTRHDWDRFDRALSVMDPVGHTTRYEYDEHGNLSVIVRPDGHQIRVAYNEFGLATELIEADGSVWRQAFDAVGNRTVLVDPGGNRTRYAYDDHGGMASVTEANGHTTRMRCNAAGLVIAVTDPAGEVTRYGRDSFGRVTEVIDPLGSVRRAEYTVEGLRRRQVDPLGGTQTWSWDGEGNLLRHTNESGGVTRFEYGPFDLPIARTDPDGARHEFVRDTEMRVTRVINPQGLAWDYTYDEGGRLVAESDFDGREVSYRRDAAGQLIARSNALGETVTYTRDPLGNITEKHIDGQAITYTYDLVGRLITAGSPECELVIDRDVLGQILSETVNGRVLTHTYDAVGRPLTRTTPSGLTSTWTYDETGHTASLMTAGRTLTFDHDAAGRETSRRLGADVTLAQSWDAAGRPAVRALAVGSREMRRRSYDFRADHYLTRITDDSGTTSLELDPAGRVTTLTAPTGTEAYTYDAAGNQASAHWTGSHGSDGIGERSYAGTRVTRAGRIRYEYDRAGRTVLRQKSMLSKKPLTWRYAWNSEDQLIHVITPDGTRWRYSYDPLGRRIAKERVTRDGEGVAERTVFTWHENTLVEQTTTSGDQEQDGPATLTWNYDGLHPVTQVEGTSRDASQSEIDRRFYAIVTDLVGTPTELFDDTGAIVWQERTTLWGSVAVRPDGTAYIPLRFPGQYRDPETGWHYNFHRHYDPETARYTTPDPLGLTPAPNHYTYPHNPHTWADPLGLATHENLPEGYTPSPALRGDPYHPDAVAARRAQAAEDYRPSVADRAAELGYTRRVPPQRAPFNSHGQPVFSDGRNYITPDIDGHNVTDGWKMFDRRGRRMGTHDADLNYVKE